MMRVWLASGRRPSGGVLAGAPDAARDSHRLLGEVQVPVVDRVRDALRADRVVLRRRRGAEDLGPDPFRDLRRGDPDPPGGSVDQQPLARLEPAHDHECRVCSRVVDRKRGPLLEAERIRKREHLVRGDADQLGVPAEAGAGEHPVADRVRVDALADALDLAGDLVADHAGRRRSVRVDPRARHQVGEVDPRGPHGDSDLPGPDCRLRAVLDPQHLRSAVAGDHDCLHGASLSGHSGERGWST